MEQKTIIIDVERMKYPNTGLYNYCQNLVKYISETTDFHFIFFTHKNVKLQQGLEKINKKWTDRIFLKSPSKYSLWHGTHQTTQYVPVKPTKFVLTIHDLNFLYEKTSKVKIKKLLLKIQKMIDKADYITTISNFTLQEVQKNLILHNKKVKVIYNGVKLNRYSHFDAPKYKPKNKFLFTLSTVLPKKNIHVLVKLLKKFPYELLIGGIQPNKNYLQKIKNEAKKEKVLNRVKFLGAVDEKEKYWYMNNCKAFMFPSLAEGFGLPVIEAMQLGKPVFLSTHTSLPEIGGKFAYYFTNFEESSMNKTLEEGLKDYEENKRKDNIIEWGNQFTWEKAANQYNEIYKEILFT